MQPVMESVHSSRSSSRGSLDHIDLYSLSQDDLVRRYRNLENNHLSNMSDHSRKMADINKLLQSHLDEIRNLKDINGKLQKDNVELRDLCCYLDEDRKKGKDSVSEWKEFGQYSAGIIETNIKEFQAKVLSLEKKQERMMAENTELKDICLMLDQERRLCRHCDRNIGLVQPSGRDEGDGSSQTSDLVEDRIHENKVSDQTVNYIGHLEDRVRVLETENVDLAGKLKSLDYREWQPYPDKNSAHMQTVGNWTNGDVSKGYGDTSSRPTDSLSTKALRAKEDGDWLGNSHNI